MTGTTHEVVLPSQMLGAWLTDAYAHDYLDDDGWCPLAHGLGNHGKADCHSSPEPLAQRLLAIIEEVKALEASAKVVSA